MRKTAIAGLAVIGLASTAYGAQAQTFGIEIYAGDEPVYGYSDTSGYGRGYGYYGSNYGYRPAAPLPRYDGITYGYRYRNDAVEERSDRGGCGTFFYWDGERCADARNK